MKCLYTLLLAPALLLAIPALAQTPTPPPPTEKILVVSPAVGEVIDGGEKARYGLFMYYSANDFVEASFYRSLSPDSSITLRSHMRDGRELARPFTRAEYLAVRETIERRLKELGETVPTAAPVGKSQPGATLPTTAPATAGDYPFVLGNNYHIDTRDGTAFIGRLVGMTLTSLDFDSPTLGKVTAQRADVTRVETLNASQPSTTVGLVRKRYDIGNGNRLFFGPTGRGLRKGEGTLQDIDLYLVGANYGISDYLSIGGYLSLLPGLPLNQQLLMFTPKLSLPIKEDVHFGVGLLYINVPYETVNSNTSSIGAGIGYGAFTYGTADNNLTLGIGYGFVEGEIGKTPLLMVGGQTRVSKLISLISENYIVADIEAGMAGLYGLKFNWRKASLGLAGGYYFEFQPDPDPYGVNPNPQQFHSTYLIPVYIDFTFRFGKGARQPEAQK